MRYICILCGAGGGCAVNDPHPPATYHCHECPGQSTMWQHTQAAVYAAAIESHQATIQLGLKIIDQVLPQAGSISIDVGAVNEFCMRARK